MAQYEYRCDRDGALEVSRPIGTAPATFECPSCGRPAPRSFTGPMLSFAPRALVRAVDDAERTREAPDVVTAPPPAARRRTTTTVNPLHRGLPRP
ncbi:hypothetical protein MO973_27765 [Paenibacillus sp. TRM 82003]|uniref:hypothetical protein n=1 Tax=Kineococcus sp. TRM81007 TaxID=2925831 RepID=UPI001F58A713|nr:hypothetical protein [Kineococcus sp. TRM81007]MCI2238297.1 hypothetical protein [Kineococcus sp. TRM81007]MCI3924031.1 hypothetical protein [Paenibacillus sp. TRM 82003]